MAVSASGKAKHDNEKVSAFFSAIGVKAVPVKTHRFRPSNSRKKSSDRATPGVILVVFKSREEARSVLARAHHHGKEDWTGIYAREERTDAQQEEFNKFILEKK